ncbi:hypothetical protein CPC08DRAFT_120195 [Agrocybe pediades]|nr:hypothetical protein CPC08DRAFT_120195 [Agrocybe pediades]
MVLPPPPKAVHSRTQIQTQLHRRRHCDCNATPHFPENHTGTPTAPRALGQFMKDSERGELRWRVLIPLDPPYTLPGIPANMSSRFHSPGDRARERDDERNRVDRARAADRARAGQGQARVIEMSGIGDQIPEGAVNSLAGVAELVKRGG